jgi:hypothetical protein
MSEPLLPLLRAYAAERRRTLTEHPTPDELLDYHLGDVTPGQRERIQDHLALCPDCTRSVLDLAAFPDIVAAEGGDRLPDTAAAWTRLREHTFLAAPAAIRPPRASRRRARALSLIAASLLVASLAGYRLGRLGSIPEGQPFTPMLRETEIERSASAPEEILVPGSVKGVFPLILSPDDTEGFTRFEVEILQLDRPVLRETGLGSDASGNVSVYVPRDLSGPLAVRLFGVGEGERTQLMEQWVDIRWPDSED